MAKRPTPDLTVIGVPRAISTRSDGDVVLQGSSLWQGLPNEHCRRQPCMWSEKEQSNIDLSHNVFSRISFMALECSEPRGGQTATQHGKQPEIAFVVTMHNRGRMTAQCLLELFRWDLPLNQLIVKLDLW